MGALDDLKIVDLSRAVPGPYCTMLLGDMGADVVLVEAPEGNERAAGQATPSDPKRNALRRNKRSIRVDLTTEAGREVVRRLVTSADVFLEGFRPGVATRLGVDYPTLSALNPRLVYCSLSGFGQTGPYAQLAGHDIDYIAVAGALSLTGRHVPSNLIADMAGGGLMAAFAITTALLHRSKTGRGQYIDASMTDGTVSLMARSLSLFFESGPSDRLTGGLPQYGVYACADGKHLAIGALEPWLYEKLCAELGFDGQGDAREHFTRRFAEKPRAQWLEQLQKVDACAMPVHELPDVLDDPHVRARGLSLEFDGVRQVGVVPKLSATPGAVRSLGPSPGEHTNAVLDELGYSAAERDALLAAKAVG